MRGPTLASCKRPDALQHPALMNRNGDDQCADDSRWLFTALAATAGAALPQLLRI